MKSFVVSASPGHVIVENFTIAIWNEELGEDVLFQCTVTLSVTVRWRRTPFTPGSSFNPDNVIIFSIEVHVMERPHIAAQTLSIFL